MENKLVTVQSLLDCSDIAEALEKAGETENPSGIIIIIPCPGDIRVVTACLSENDVIAFLEKIKHSFLEGEQNDLL
jgi:hypothetical protein